MKKKSEDVMIMSDGSGHPPLTLRRLNACEEMRACMSQRVAIPRHCFRRAKPRSTQSPGGRPPLQQGSGPPEVIRKVYTAVPESMGSILLRAVHPMFLSLLYLFHTL